jgi:predicted metal-binding membrane protein
VDNGGRLSAMPALLELAGAVFVIAGFLLVWLPLGLVATGILLILSAVALERVGAAAETRGRVG